MLYVSAYRRSSSFAMLFRWLQVIVVAFPLVPLLIAWLSESNAAKRVELAQVLPFVLLALLGLVWIIRWGFRQSQALEVEIDSMGIRHLAPGKQKTLLWQDVIEAKVVPINKSERAMRVKTKEQRYVLQPHLVPDTPDAPILKLGFPKTYWLYPDGRREVADPQHSFGYKVVAQYRPDLLAAKLAAK